jgi:hypothetical protein
MEWMGMEHSGQNVPKRRSQADKIGKHKYEIALLHRIEDRQIRNERMMRIIIQGFSDYFRFDRPLVEKVCCESDMDLAVVSAVYEAGSVGILAKAIAPRFPQYRLEKHKILRIIIRVNKNAVDAFDKPLVEKRGKKWAFTDFGVEIWGKTKKDLKEDARSNYDVEKEDVE